MDFPVTGGAIPIAAKLAYSAFMSVLVPVYLRRYGWTNFLYFCDVALFLALAGVWLEDPLLLSIPAVGILLPQVFWLLDFLLRMVGRPITGMTAYMFDAQRSLFLRGLSLFHGWLPLFLVWTVSRTGYDPRALPIWSGIAAILLLVCYFFMPPPRPNRGLKPVNINYVYGMSDERAQTVMPRTAWLAVQVLGAPVLLYWPAHVLLMRWMPPA
ncbi:MAG TPA: hypothetical protein VJM11_14540 [Nevskiaceae bacterium]|nr:hypothetical protein [Nevskiaceae bacterium]